MSSLAVEGEDGLMLLLGMCELEFTEVECFDFHGITYKLSCGLYFDDGVIGSHVVE